MRNLDACVKARAMSTADAAAAMQMLASRIGGPVGIGIWEGSIAGKISGQTYGGEHVAVFRAADLVSPFGPRGDEESEACAALFCLALKHAATLGSLAAAAGAVLDAWEKGDLAGAVRSLAAALDRVAE